MYLLLFFYSFNNSGLLLALIFYKEKSMMHCARNNYFLLTKMAAVQAKSMYKLPAFYDDSSPVELSNCMYSVKSYHKKDNTENLCNGINENDFSALEKRQETLVNGLKSLQNEVRNFASKLGVRLPSKSCSKTVDHVISASPDDPPLSVFFLQHILKQRGVAHSTSMFTHSTAAGVDLSKLPSFEQSQNDKGRNSPCVITVIWKNAPELPVLVMSSNHTPLVGEFTIARHICRTILPDLYGKLGFDKIAEVDHWMTIATDDIVNGKSKERANALHYLNAALGKSSWLVGNQLTLADIAVASAVIKTGSSKAPANVKKWLENFESQQ